MQSCSNESKPVSLVAHVGMLTHLVVAGGGLLFGYVGVMDVKEVVANHLLPHAARALRHVQLEFVQVRTNGWSPKATFP